MSPFRAVASAYLFQQPNNCFNHVQKAVGWEVLRWLWVQPMVHFWGRCTTHYGTYLSGLGMFTGATIWLLTHSQVMFQIVHSLGPKSHPFAVAVPSVPPSGHDGLVKARACGRGTEAEALEGFVYYFYLLLWRFFGGVCVCVLFFFGLPFKATQKRGSIKKRPQKYRRTSSMATFTTERNAPAFRGRSTNSGIHIVHSL